MKRRTPRRLWGAAGFAGIITLALVGCNSILDNKPGVLATDENAIDPGPGVTPPTSDGGSSQLPPINGTGDSGTVTDSSTPPPPPPPGDAGGGGCGAGKQLCHGVCVSTTDPLYGCGNGACTPCPTSHSTMACQATQCVVAACDPGYADCNGTPADGCETDLSKAASCGACNAVCPATAPVCAPSGTTFACTTGCSAAAPLLCGTECVDPASSVNHCGACNAACPPVENATTACTAGTCTFACKAPYHACGGKCAVATDTNACGPTCAVCPAPPNARALCTNDACAFQCEAGFADCNLNPADGCEVALATDMANCGVCGNACAAGGACKAGACEAPPPPPPPPPADAGP